MVKFKFVLSHESCAGYKHLHIFISLIFFCRCWSKAELHVGYAEDAGQVRLGEVHDVLAGLMHLDRLLDGLESKKKVLLYVAHIFAPSEKNFL